MNKYTTWMAVGLMLVACSSHRADRPSSESPPGDETHSRVSSVIAIDGSSTVFPISEAIAEEFQKKQEARVTIGVSGTGGGFKKFCSGEIAITGASRSIKLSESEHCRKMGIQFLELPIAYDGIAVVVHKDAAFADPITVEELKRIWEPAAQAKITRWNQVRPSWPDAELLLFGPGVDSGTYDYFTAAVVGEEHASRGDFTSSEDDNTLVHGVATAPGALGFFGYGFYAENKDKLRLLGVDPGTGPVRPSPESVANGTYQPLSRPIFLYVSNKALANKDVAAFVEYYLEKGRPMVSEVGFIPLPDAAQKLVQARFEQRILGSVFREGPRVGATVESLLAGQ